VVVVDLNDDGLGLPEIATLLAEDPTRAVTLVREHEPAAVVLHPSAFEALVEAALDAQDAAAAVEALASESLASFAEYHARRLARRAASQ
jgi:PHD/YefM family antitoxin component YafN of YafNO toxin-antitoxin module